MATQQHHAGAFQAVAYGWVFPRAGHPPDRYLVRQCATCHHLDWVSLIWVDERYLTCLTCLSQNVEYDEDTDSVVCLECQARSPMDEAADDGDDDDEELYGKPYDPEDE